jgi:hypothetical protein
MKHGGFMKVLRATIAGALVVGVGVALAPFVPPGPGDADAAFTTDPTPFEIDGDTGAAVGGVDWTTQPSVEVSNDANYTGTATVPV